MSALIFVSVSNQSQPGIGYSCRQSSPELPSGTGTTCHGTISNNFFIKPNLISFYSRPWPTWASAVVGISGKRQVVCSIPRRRQGKGRKGKLSSQPNWITRNLNNSGSNVLWCHTWWIPTHPWVQPSGCQLQPQPPVYGLYRQSVQLAGWLAILWSLFPFL